MPTPTTVTIQSSFSYNYIFETATLLDIILTKKETSKGKTIFCFEDKGDLLDLAHLLRDIIDVFNSKIITNYYFNYSIIED